MSERTVFLTVNTADGRPSHVHDDEQWARMNKVSTESVVPAVYEWPTTDQVVHLVQTCLMCPEQYDALIGDRVVGYLRLRGGEFDVRVPQDGDSQPFAAAMGPVVFRSHPHGSGSFEDWERPIHLDAARRAILAHIARKAGL